MEVQRSHDCWPDYWGRSWVRKRCKCFADSAFHQLEPFLSFYRAQIGSVSANSFAAMEWRTCVCRRHSPSLPRMLPGFASSMFGIPRTLGWIFIQGVGVVSRFISHVAVSLVTQVRLLHSTESLSGLRSSKNASIFSFQPNFSGKCLFSVWFLFSNLFVYCSYVRLICASASLDTAAYNMAFSFGGTTSLRFGLLFLDWAGLRLFGAFVGDIGGERHASGALQRRFR